jgi:hypothetical protein
MKRTSLKKKLAISIIMGLSLLGVITAMYQSPQKAYASIGGGGSGKTTIPDPNSNPNNPDWIVFNPALNTPQAQYYSTSSGRWGAFPADDFYQVGSTLELKLWREAYVPNNPSLFNLSNQQTFVWYTPNPPASLNAHISTQDPGLIYENTQNLEGYVGSGMQASNSTPFVYDLSTTAQNPFTFTKMGTNSNPTTLQAGTFAGKKYTWRFSGYTVNGASIDNPFYPIDIQSLYNYVSDGGANSPSLTARQLGSLDWLTPQNTLTHQSWWDIPQYDKGFGVSSQENANKTQKDGWFNTYLFAQYPGLTLYHSLNYWEQTLMPMGDPSTEAVVWTGWVNFQGGQYYLSLTTHPPAQPNLRLVTMKVYDPSGKLMGTYTRNSSGDGSSDSPSAASLPGLTPGVNYKMVATVQNVNPPSVTVSIPGKPIEQEMNAMLGNTTIGGKIDWTQFPTNVQWIGTSPASTSLASGANATFTWHYTIPTSTTSKTVTIASQIPTMYIQHGLDTDPNDDQAALTFPISKIDLSLIQLKVYNSSGTLLGEEYRTTGDMGYFTPSPSSLPSLSPGSTYKVQALIKNMSSADVPSSVTMQQEIGAMLDNTTVGGTTNWSPFSSNASWVGNPTPSAKGLAAGATDTYTWSYKVPSSTNASTITIASQIPSTYSSSGYDTDLNNDKSSLTFPIGNENLAVSFMGYLNSSYQTLTHISMGYYNYWQNDYVEYKVTLTTGQRPVTDPKLNINVSSGNSSFSYPNEAPIGLYHANGEMKGTLVPRFRKRQGASR